MIVQARERTELALDTVTAVDLVYALGLENDPTITNVVSDRSISDTKSLVTARIVGDADVTAGRDVRVDASAENDHVAHGEHRHSIGSAT